MAKLNNSNSKRVQSSNLALFKNRVQRTFQPRESEGVHLKTRLPYKLALKQQQRVSINSFPVLAPRPIADESVTPLVNFGASGAAKNPSASVTETVVQKKRGRPLKARKTTSSRPSIAGSPRPILDSPQLSIGLPADTPAVGTAIAANEVKKVLVALKQAVGCQDILDEEFLDLLKRTNPNLLGDILSIKHQLQTTSHNRSKSAKSRPG
ncbi:MAG: hypothetical protein Q9177_004302 [Variospora cf. flavescens]